MATQTLEANDVNDLYLPDGENLVVLSGAAACQQNILEKTLLRLTEDIYNQSNGVDYFGTILTPQVNYDGAYNSLSTQILSCPDVISIETLTIAVTPTLNPVNGLVENVFSFTADVMTVYGPLTVSNAT
jgi:hypothetical protein